MRALGGLCVPCINEARDPGHCLWQLRPVARGRLSPFTLVAFFVAQPRPAYAATPRRAFTSASSSVSLCINPSAMLSRVSRYSVMIFTAWS
jgi:hypothetical protein